MSDEHQNLPSSPQPETKRYAIREGAGLDESRVNQDFIDALQKYGVWVLVGAALLLAGYNGWTYLERERTESRHAAYTALSDAMEAGSPSNLLGVAVEHDAHGAVGVLARLQAADLYLAAYRTGLVPGAQLTPDGKPANDADVLSDELRTDQLDRAAAQYQAVYDKTKDNEDYALHTIGALFGLAAVAESKNQLDEARNAYTRIVELSEKAMFPLPGQTAKARIESLDTLGQTPTLYATEDVLALKPPPAPEPEPAAAPGGVTTNPDGTVSIPGLEGTLTPVNPEDVPADVRERQPAPAPESEPSPTP